MTQSAGWHKNCYLKLNKTKLESLQGTSRAEAMAHSSSTVHTRSAVAKLTAVKPLVFSAINQLALHCFCRVGGLLEDFCMEECVLRKK